MSYELFMSYHTLESTITLANSTTVYRDQYWLPHVGILPAGLGSISPD